ncbi:hypothetical protein QFZ37_000723 [Chryseobacterium ginsenosidimutans]|uniref:hypothetical protein n=1 Tax=Chryseobacterium ginsenosidimutans TaxID=687846 RepID=UPI00278477B0|nr:hypothetical protein [Chryseobacterium ginsenosidimutans]MDQ0592354.1 hypothetical protein [Chryseobacterium ginsenosidimutans]
MKKKLIVLVVFLFVAIIYFVFYHKKSAFTIVSANADVIILVDAKKLTRQYVYNLAIHPSQWFGSKNENKSSISILKSGVEIPDFFQVFHLKNSRFSDWYSVFELKDKQKFITFLKQQKFTDQGNNIFRKDQVYIKLLDKNCIVGTSDQGFESIDYQMLSSSKVNILDAEELISNGLGSILFTSDKVSQNLSIELNSDEITIKNNSNSYDPAPIISKLRQTILFLETELDAKNIKTFSSLFDKTFESSSQINYLKATAELEQVNDTIITYGYDDNFNEIEKKSFQKIIQPNYVIDIQSLNIKKTEQYFQNKKWINTQKQFTAIPFQPNYIEKNTAGFEIKSTRKPIQLSPKRNENYIFVRNNALLLSSFKSLTTSEKKLISNIDYIFYGNNDQDYYLELQFKKQELPLILRW